MINFQTWKYKFFLESFVYKTVDLLKCFPVELVKPITDDQAACN